MRYVRPNHDSVVTFNSSYGFEASGYVCVLSSTSAGKICTTNLYFWRTGTPMTRAKVVVLVRSHCDENKILKRAQEEHFVYSLTSQARA